MDHPGALGEFLRSRRARLSPDDVGLPDFGRRRVPGLRREELAQLAGVSTGYYARLEQGQSTAASEAVLDALARALRLDEDERIHLISLSQQKSRSRRRPRPEVLRPGIRVMVNAFADVPALVLGRRTDVLAWNPMAHALLAGHLDFGASTNWARQFFLDPHTRELFVDWPEKAGDTVADLRLIAGRYPDDLLLHELIGELTVKSPEFAKRWAAHPVRNCASHVREYAHPVVGRLTLADELLRLPDDEGQRLVVFTAEPDSPSEAALKLLKVAYAAPNAPKATFNPPASYGRA